MQLVPGNDVSQRANAHFILVRHSAPRPAGFIKIAQQRECRCVFDALCDRALTQARAHAHDAGHDRAGALVLDDVVVAALEGVVGTARRAAAADLAAADPGLLARVARQARRRAWQSLGLAPLWTELRALADSAREVDDWYAAYLRGLTESDFEQVLDFVFTSGKPARMTRGEIIRMSACTERIIAATPALFFN